MAATLANLKTLLGLEGADQDELLNLILTNTTRALCFKLAEETVPEELDYIVLEVSASRFGRLKNEGMAAYSQEGESITFKATDFDDFLTDIATYKHRHQKDVNTNGRATFINPYGGDHHAF